MIIVYTTKDGKTRYRVRIDVVDPETGKRFKRRLGAFGSRREAEREEFKALEERDRGTLLAPDTTTVGVLLDEWLNHKRPQLSTNAATDYEITIRKHLKPAFGAVLLQRLTMARIQSQYARWSQVDDGGDPSLSAYVVRNCHLRLCAALDFAVRMKLLAGNPARDAMPPRLARNQIAFWNAEEARAFLTAVQAYHAFWSQSTAPRHLIPAVLWDLLLREGMRRGEALGLRWRDVNWERGTAHIQQTITLDKAKGGASQIQGRAKTKAGERTVRLSPETITALKERQQQWRLKKLASGNWQEADLIVCTADGRPVNPSNVRRSFLAILKQFAPTLPVIKVHELRHTSATLLLAAGVSPKVVSERLGHASISITLDIYSAVLPDLQETASDAMSRVLG